MRGKRELPRKRPPFLLFVLIFAAGFLAGTLFWHFRPFDASVPSGGTATLPDTSAGTEVSPEPELPPAPPQEEEPSAEPAPFVISFLGDCTLTSSHHTNHFEKLVGDDYAYPFSNVAELLLADDLTLANLECSFSPRRLESDSEYAFCGDPNYVQALVLGSVEAVTLSNNHTRDFGDAGLRDTEAALAEYGVAGIPGNQEQCFELRHGNGDTLRLGAYVHPFNGSAKQMEDGCKRLRDEGRGHPCGLYARRGRKNLRPHQAPDGAGPCRREGRRRCGGGDPPPRFAAHRSLSGQRDPVQHRQFLLRRQPESVGQGYGHRPAHRVRQRRGPFVGDVLYPLLRQQRLQPERLPAHPLPAGYGGLPALFSEAGRYLPSPGPQA